jgi:hypothetical protein
MRRRECRGRERDESFEDAMTSLMLWWRLAKTFLDTETLKCDVTKRWRRDALFSCLVSRCQPVVLLAPFHGPPPFMPGSSPVHRLFTPFFFTSHYNVHCPECTSHSPLLLPSSHFSTRSNLNGATTASTKTFLTALVLNSAIATGEIVVFTLVRRYYRLIYEPRSLSVFEACACPSILPFLLLIFFQEETATTVTSHLRMDNFRPQGRLS